VRLEGIVASQLGIDWTPSGRELSRAVHKRECRRERMLTRLRSGPVSTWEMMMLGGPGFSSRLREPRNEGHNIVAEGGPEAWVYRLL
jgi:hypothetical protein